MRTPVSGLRTEDVNQGAFRVKLRTFLMVNNTFWTSRLVEGSGRSSVAGELWRGHVPLSRIVG